MKGDPLPDGDRILRYLSPTLIRDGSAKGAGFHLRPSDIEGFSVDWLEFLAKAGADPLGEVRRVSRLRLRPRGRFAELRVGDILRAVAEELATLQVVHDPLPAEGDYPANPAHSLVRGLPPHDTDEAMLVGDLIAECVTAMHPAVVESG